MAQLVCEGTIDRIGMVCVTYGSADVIYVVKVGEHKPVEFYVPAEWQTYLALIKPGDHAKMSFTATKSGAWTLEHASCPALGPLSQLKSSFSKP